MVQLAHSPLYLGQVALMTADLALVSKVFQFHFHDSGLLVCLVLLPCQFPLLRLLIFLPDLFIQVLLFLA